MGDLMGRADLVDDLLQALLELTAVLSASDQSARVHREHALIHQGLRNVTKRDQLGQALSDRRLADARLSDQGGVVFRPAAEDLDYALDLALPPANRFERVLSRKLLHAPAQPI